MANILRCYRHSGMVMYRLLADAVRRTFLA